MNKTQEKIYEFLGLNSKYSINRFLNPYNGILTVKDLKQYSSVALFEEFKVTLDKIIENCHHLLLEYNYLFGSTDIDLLEKQIANNLKFHLPAYVDVTIDIWNPEHQKETVLLELKNRIKKLKIELEGRY